MRKAIYECPNCGHIDTVTLGKGKKPEEERICSYCYPESGGYFVTEWVIRLIKISK
jgi:transcription elongation factor Elf1